ncbi:MAG TPA: ROK family protein [Tepidisphaeraceae bacterium]|jgi:predicted NBD/HSP70 family sugar kinase
MAKRSKSARRTESKTKSKLKPRPAAAKARGRSRTKTAAANKRPSRARIAKPRPNIFLGVDVGATKIGINAIDQTRTPINPNWSQVPAFTEQGPQKTVEQIVAGVRLFLDENNLPVSAVAAVGLDSPGPADNQGVIQPSANMKHPEWAGFKLRESVEKALSRALSHPVTVTYENDGNAAAFWESFIGNPEGTEVMAMLAPGTGLGGGIVINGQLLRGARGMAAELGHVEIAHDPFTPGSQHQPCGCGQMYCAEAYVSVAGLQKALPAALAQDKYAGHALLQIDNVENLWKRRALEVRPLAARGDALCLALFDWQAQALGKLCRQVADTIDPDRIVIGGGFIEGGQELTDRILRITRETFEKLAFPKHATEVRIETAQAADQAGCLGAALSAWTSVNAKR